jgi:hypothetical protein
MLRYLIAYAKTVLSCAEYNHSAEIQRKRKAVCNYIKRDKCSLAIIANRVM